MVMCRGRPMVLCLEEHYSLRSKVGGTKVGLLGHGGSR